ncbi:hypothetical protein HN011_000221 [Eciton burchellii]|nr:hypothetical protein HN011_000221 [Eciton burchellii]
MSVERDILPSAGESRRYLERGYSIHPFRLLRCTSRTRMSVKTEVLPPSEETTENNYISESSTSHTSISLHVSMSQKVNITAEAHSANVSSANEYEHRSVLLFEESQENHLQFRLEFLFVRQQDSTLQKIAEFAEQFWMPLRLKY